MNRAKKVIIHLIIYPLLIAGVVLGLFKVVQAAVGNIDSTNKYVWGANVGWINFAPADGGVTIYRDHLEGYAWGENVGWIRMGSYSGGGSHTYLNTDQTNYGINITATNVLTGYAWGANVGWINFSPSNGGVTIDWATGSLNGDAWGENVGWIRFKNTGGTAYNVAANFVDLFLSKSVNPSSAAAGETITYTLSFSNSGSYTATGVIITDIIPVSVTNSSVVSSGVSITQTVPGYVWAVQDLAPGDEGIITITGQISTSLAVTNIATITTTSVDSDTNNNSSTATVAPFDLAISKSSIRNEAAITYTVSVFNIGSTTAPGAIISDAVPSGMAGSTWYWNCVASNGATCPNATGNGDINETSGSFPVNGQLVYNITATLAISTATMTNTATVTSLNGLGDSDSGNNSATDISSSTSTSGGIYLPIICKAGCLNLTVTGSDLIIVPGSLVASSSAITLQIQNSGNTATSGDFWVDVYFNPSQTPTLNKTWQSIASYGAAWGVTQSLAAGEVVTLTVGGTYYNASKSSSSFLSGANVYGYVDSVNYATTYGAVQESNENNNLSGPVTSTAGGAGPIVVGGGSVSGGSLPKR